ncbi:predicted protein [Phaeodactylum tricornutum CCAP 1055/1]|jgi:hypothetical protein|uniref:PDZ domain-containing protein n=1 Tax=Phaeodactylum tricornutum (strain CCAP 1055/1) TaxID=556484 RepID=B5Y4Y6_PHATC|nr:predicted protein [Phaeodactylum tricornutum CCAP 1055/1]ACI65848.1 predicted protein [Phaeodactylum tricornutum CCAP 1055/1]|eukprot:XP_002186378.1 predicted protein [Phaeodactylum tricornutum CCAP 1055/1]
METAPRRKRKFPLPIIPIDHIRPLLCPDQLNLRYPVHGAELGTLLEAEALFSVEGNDILLMPNEPAAKARKASHNPQQQSPELVDSDSLRSTVMPDQSQRSTVDSLSLRSNKDTECLREKSSVVDSVGESTIARQSPNINVGIHAAERNASSNTNTNSLPAHTSDAEEYGNSQLPPNSPDDAAVSELEQAWMGKLDRDISVAEQNTSTSKLVDRIAQAVKSGVQKKVFISRKESCGSSNLDSSLAAPGNNRRHDELSNDKSSSALEVIDLTGELSDCGDDCEVLDFPERLSLTVPIDAAEQSRTKKRPLDLKVVRATKLVPKRLESGGDLVFSVEDFQRYLVGPFNQREGRKLESAKKAAPFAAKVISLKKSPDVWKVLVEGHPDTVSSFEVAMVQWVGERIHGLNFQKLKLEGLPKDVLLEFSHPIGAKLRPARYVVNNRESRALLISINVDGQLGKALAPLVTVFGCAVALLDGLECRTISEFKSVLKNAAKKGQPLYKLSLLLAKESNAAGRGLHQQQKSSYLSGGLSSFPSSANLLVGGPNTTDDSANILSGANVSIDSSVKTSLHIPRKALESKAGSKQERTYEVLFDAQQPLGFYCIALPSGISQAEYCLIVSICPGGQASRDGRIRPGSVVRSVSGEDRLLGIEQLFEIYEMAKRKNHIISLSFLDRLSPLNGSMSQAFGEWTAKGHWKGRVSHGWAGGALQTLDTSNRVSRERDPHGIQKQLSIGSGETGRKSMDDGRPCMAEHPPNSCRTSTGSSGDRRVRFMDAIHERHYSIDSKPCEFYEKHSGLALLPKDKGAGLGHTIPCDNQSLLLRSIKSGSFRDVIVILEEGLLSSAKSTASLIVAKSYVKEQLASLQQNGITDAASERDWMLKDVLTKIFLKAAHVYENAKSLKEWSRYEVIFLGLEEVQLSSSGGLQFNQDCISVRLSARYPDSNQQSELAKSLPVPLSKDILFGKELSVPRHMHYNKCVASKRSVVVDICKNGEASGSVKCIGSTVLKIQDLQRKCPRNGTWLESSKAFSNRNLFGSASIRFRARRLPVEATYLERKRKTECIGLKDVINWIKRFNDGLCPEERDAQLTFTVPVFDNASLLHSAILIQESPLVEELLYLGADPKRRSVIGSPVFLAHNLRHKLIESLAETSNSEIADTDAYQERERGPDSASVVSEGRCANPRKKRIEHIAALIAAATGNKLPSEPRRKVC